MCIHRAEIPFNFVIRIMHFLYFLRRQWSQALETPSAKRAKKACGGHPQLRRQRNKESPNEARAQEGGPKHCRSTSQDAKEPISHATWRGGHL
jgi:hypothetical protein